MPNRDDSLLSDPLFAFCLLIAAYALVGACMIGRGITYLILGPDLFSGPWGFLAAALASCALVAPVLALLMAAGRKSDRQDAEAAKGEGK